MTNDMYLLLVVDGNECKFFLIPLAGSMTLSRLVNLAMLPLPLIPSGSFTFIARSNISEI